MNDRLVGSLYVLGAASLWGFQAALAQFLFKNAMTPSLLVQYRITLASLILGLVLLVFRPSFLKIRPRDLLWFLSLGVFGIAANFFAYFEAIRQSSVAVAVLIQYTAPIFIAFGSFLIFKEHLDKRIFLTIGLCLSGAALVVEVFSDQPAVSSLGVLWGVIASLTYASWSLHAAGLNKRYAPLQTLFWGLLCATVFWNLIHSPLQLIESNRSVTEWGSIAYVAIFATLVPFSLFFIGMNKMGPTRAALVATTEPFFAAVFAAILVGETLSPLQVMGGLLILAGVAALNLASNQKVP